MIIVKLLGGIGNQMFQYAAGRSLAHVLDTELKLDINGFKQCPNRFYALGHFKIQENFASSKEIFRLSGKPQTKSQKLFHRIKEYFSSTFNKFRIEAFQCKQEPPPKKSYIYTEPHFHFDPNFFNLPNNTYLDGYWQSEKYFKNIENLIRNEFISKDTLKEKNWEIAQQIQSCESVSLHVRRKDYVHNPLINKLFGVCSIQYYLEAIKKISGQIASPHFFIFSDDPEWAKNHFQSIKPVTYIDHNTPENAYEDLCLMSFCHHHIIANSTFSWWGAWLNKNTIKIVIAPIKWFGKERMKNRYLGDLYPDGWYRL